ncbi:lysine exporter LysO family protein [Parabacteroides pacaensis]|uniref:lysine exporter LysO family protein n=1 Tax=Parabacteroides pacaensis TaxID=2086575 RepID=UPI000D0F2B5A|nr:lysine exporter LysO family protein [Parabacteroides pacaensis]
MKGSIIIVSFFIMGAILGWAGWLPQFLLENDHTLYALYVLMFLVGVSLGSDRKLKKIVRGINIKVFFIPLATIVGTLLGSALISLVLVKLSLTDCLAVGSGFGYYSLSSVFITQYKGAELGTIALTSNIIREIMTFLGAPLFVKYFGKFAPICAGGATTMDTTLPVITHYSGQNLVFVSIFHGFVVDFTVPFFVTFFCTIG